MPAGAAVQYAIQTNGLLLDEAWCRFLKGHRFLAGLSLNGNRACHDRFRRDGAGRGTYDRVLKAARLLEREGVEFNILTVVTGYLARRVRSVFAALCGPGAGPADETLSQPPQQENRRPVSRRAAVV